jgi:hypothetical protein
MTNSRIYLLNKSYPGIPVECKYAAEINGVRKFFEKKEEAMLYLFDQGVRNFQYLTKEAADYKGKTKLPSYEFWHIENRVGYVGFDNEFYVSVNNEIKKRKAFVWRFVGYGRSVFAQTEEELKEKVIHQIKEYNEDPKGYGYNTYPFYTRYYRAKQ